MPISQTDLARIRIRAKEKERNREEGRGHKNPFQTEVGQVVPKQVNPTGRRQAAGADAKELEKALDVGCQHRSLDRTASAARSTS